MSLPVIAARSPRRPTQRAWWRAVWKTTDYQEVKCRQRQAESAEA